MTARKPSLFSLPSGSVSDDSPPSRSRSLDRTAAHPPPAQSAKSNSRSPHRRPAQPHHSSSSHGFGTGRHFLVSEPDSIGSPPCHHHLVSLDEEAALEGDGSTSASERDSLLRHGHARGTDSPKRRLTFPSNGYGATHDGDGATLKRSESILRVAGLIDDRSGEYEQFRKSDAELAKMSKKVRKFYQRQNETLVRTHSLVPRQTT